VSPAAGGEPLSLSHIRIVRPAGPSSGQPGAGLDPLAEGAPVVLRYHTPRWSSASDEAVVGRLSSSKRHDEGNHP
jgi:hypothetical protein